MNHSSFNLLRYFKLRSIQRIKFTRRSSFRRILPTIFLIFYFYVTLPRHESTNNQSAYTTVKYINHNNSCHFKPSTDEFILNYKPESLLGQNSDVTRFEPTTERIRNLLEILLSKEDKYQSLLETFDVFNMKYPDLSLKAYTDESNIEEIKTLYNRYIKLMPNNKTIQIDHTFIHYLKQISSYLSDGLKSSQKIRFPVECNRKPVFVLACDQRFFNLVQDAFHTLDTYWSDHKIVFYDLGITNDQENLLREKCRRCTIIKFSFSAIEQYAMYFGTLQFYSFKPFVIQDALRRYGTIIYGDSSIRFNSNTFSPLLSDNYIRGFATRILPGQSVSCYTRTGTFNWFNQSYSQYDSIDMAETSLLVVTDTFLTRLIMKAWLTCALESDCIMALGSQSICKGFSFGRHGYDKSALAIILTHFFFQSKKSTWDRQNRNNPPPYDTFTSVRMNLGDSRRYRHELNYLNSPSSCYQGLLPGLLFVEILRKNFVHC